MIRLLDGPMGTELAARGVSTDLPCWSAAALDSAPDVIAAIHRDYADAGATIHTANTFRSKRRSVGKRWLPMTELAVRLARQNIHPSHQIAGSLAPLMDCYRPELSPGAQAAAEHREMAEALAQAGCDLILCETFPCLEEAIVAVKASVATGLETWLALTAGPDANLLAPEQIALGARQAVEQGASAVLVNCTPARETLRFVQALDSEKLGVPIGAYANAGPIDAALGWFSWSDQDARQRAAAQYLELVLTWVDAGATLIGGCCGTTPQHIAAIHAALLG